MKIVFLDSTAIPKHILIPRPSFEHTWTEYDHTSSAETIERARMRTLLLPAKSFLIVKLCNNCQN